MALVGLLFLLYDDSLLMDSLSERDITPIGQVVPITNDVRHKQNQDFQWRNVRRTRILGWGDGVFTGAKSSARVELNDGSEITLQENSLVVFVPGQKDLTLDLKFGSVKSQIADNSSLMIQVDGETLSLNGQNAVVEIGKKAGEDVAIKVVSGELNIEDKNKTKQRVLAGETAGVKPTPTPKPTPKPTPVATPPPTPTPTPTPVPTPTPTPTPELPAQVGIEWTQPRNRSQYQISLDADGNPSEKARVQFNWVIPANNPVKGVGYDIQVAKDPAFKTPMVDHGIRKSQARFEFTTEGKYYARVRVKLDPESDEAKTVKTPWSSPLEVQVKFREAPTLEAPVLAKPQQVIDGDAQKSAELQWSRVKGAKNYRIEFSKSATFGPDVEKQDLDDNKLNFRPNQGGQVYYRVRGLTKDGKPGLPSMVGSVETSISTPVLKPIDSVKTLGQRPNDPPSQVELKMLWSKVTIAQGYEVNISPNADFRDPITFNTKATKGALKVTKPGTYHVRVRALNGVSEPISPYSNVEQFIYEYKIPLGSPVLKEPMNNVTLFFQDKDTVYYMGWTKVREATRYQVEVSTDEAFKRPLISVRTDDLRYLVRQAMPAGKLYWRVKAENDERESHWSEVRSLTIFNGRKAEGNGN
ncbi:MAG: FecR domain-containing protein [Bdellovibrionaceae bacterium]|nr:FecR domain-containing protein [Pseudobdellovibrionaceae bacterium]